MKLKTGARVAYSGDCANVPRTGMVLSISGVGALAQVTIRFDEERHSTGRPDLGLPAEVTTVGVGVFAPGPGCRFRVVEDESQMSDLDFLRAVDVALNELSRIRVLTGATPLVALMIECGRRRDAALRAVPTTEPAGCSCPTQPARGAPHDFACRGAPRALRSAGCVCGDPYFHDEDCSFDPAPAGPKLLPREEPELVPEDEDGDPRCDECAYEGRPDATAVAFVEPPMPTGVFGLCADCLSKEDGRRELLAWKPAVFRAEASAKGILVRDLTDKANEPTWIVSSGKSTARAFKIARKVWAEVTLCETAYAVSEALKGAGIDLHRYCGVD